MPLSVIFPLTLLSIVHYISVLQCAAQGPARSMCSPVQEPLSDKHVDIVSDRNRWAQSHRSRAHHTLLLTLCRSSLRFLAIKMFLIVISAARSNAGQNPADLFSPLSGIQYINTFLCHLLYKPQANIMYLKATLNFLETKRKLAVT